LWTGALSLLQKGRRTVARRTLLAIEVSGFRGFAETQTLRTAIPSGDPGSGLTTVVGPNNAGKSALFESLRYFAANRSISFAEGTQNAHVGGRVHLRVLLQNGETLEVATSGGSQAQYTGKALHAFRVPSRRRFKPLFAGSATNRDGYTVHVGGVARGTPLDIFGGRLHAIQASADSKNAFDELLTELLGHKPDWEVELSDGGQFYLKFGVPGSHHNSDGLGDGVLRRSQ
jgi:hypothetical protein